MSLIDKMTGFFNDDEDQDQAEGRRRLPFPYRTVEGGKCVVVKYSDQLYVTNEDRYQDYVEGDRSFDDAFKHADDLEPVRGTLYYSEDINDPNADKYDIKAIVDVGDGDEPIIIPKHACSHVETIPIAMLGRTGAAKTTLMVQLLAIAEATLAKNNITFEQDYPQNTKSNADLEEQKRRFVIDRILPEATPANQERGLLYPYYVKNGNVERLFLFEDFPGEHMEANINKSRFQHFEFFFLLVDAKEIIDCLKDIYGICKTDDILKKLVSFLPEQKRKQDVFIDVIITKMDYLRDYANGELKDNITILGEMADALEKDDNTLHAWVDAPAQTVIDDHMTRECFQDIEDFLPEEGASWESKDKRDVLQNLKETKRELEERRNILKSVIKKTSAPFKNGSDMNRIAQSFQEHGAACAKLLHKATPVMMNRLYNEFCIEDGRIVFQAISSLGTDAITYVDPINSDTYLTFDPKKHHPQNIDFLLCRLLYEQGIIEERQKATKNADSGDLRDAEQEDGSGDVISRRGFFATAKSFLKSIKEW